MSAATPEPVSAFISRWETSGAAERANHQMFLSEFCDLLGVPRPDPTAPDKAGHGKRGTAAFDKALERAFHQGRGHITALPADTKVSPKQSSPRKPAKTAKTKCLS